MVPSRPGPNLVGGIVVGLLAFVARAVVAVSWPQFGGDWANYRTVALNILWHGCVSMSEPASGDCVPHWGGNQLPGFPLFLAGVWALFPDKWTPIALMQSLLCAVAIGYLAWSLQTWIERRFALISSLVVALSPLTVGWTRFGLPDAVALAASIWTLAELVRSLAEQRLRVVSIGLAATVAIYFRYDSALLAVPIAVTGFWLHSPIEAIRRGSVILAMVLVAFGGWGLRSHAVGLGHLPNFYFVPHGGTFPVGFFHWNTLWSRSEYEGPLWGYSIYTREYSRIQVPDHAFRSESERKRVVALLAELAQFDGQAFPTSIDREFAALAAERRAAEPFLETTGRYVLRAVTPWWNPRNSSGWPVSLGYGVGSVIDGDLVNIAFQNPGVALVKVGTAVYRLMLIVVVAVLAVLAISRRLGAARPLVLAAIALAVAKTSFMAASFFLESRYLTGVVPFLEVTAVAGIGAWFAKDIGLTLVSQSGSNPTSERA